MWDHIINIYSSELLTTNTKEFRINESWNNNNNNKVFYNN